MQVGDALYLKEDNREVKIVEIDGEKAIVSYIAGNRLQSSVVPLSSLVSSCPARDKILSKMTPEAAGLVGRNPR